MGRLILLCLFVYQTTTAQLNIRGTEYTIVGEMAEYYAVPRTNQEGFPDLIWEEINIGDESSMVRAFLRDAITHGANLDLGGTHNFIQIVSRRHPSLSFGSGSSARAATAVSITSTLPGFRIRVNEDHWRAFNGIEKIKILYHELGHALLHAGHVCHRSFDYNMDPVFANSIMSTGACPIYETISFVCPPVSVFPQCMPQEGPGLHLIEDWIDHLFANIVLLEGTSLGPGNGFGQGSAGNTIYD